MCSALARYQDVSQGAVVGQEAWPPGTTFDEYLQSSRQTVLAETSGIFVSRYYGERQLGSLGHSAEWQGPRGGPWLLVEYRVGLNCWVTGYQPRHHSLNSRPSLIGSTQTGYVMVPVFDASLNSRPSLIGSTGDGYDIQHLDRRAHKCRPWPAGRGHRVPARMGASPKPWLRSRMVRSHPCPNGSVTGRSYRKRNVSRGARIGGTS
jgi:hypothetical protein